MYLKCWQGQLFCWKCRSKELSHDEKTDTHKGHTQEVGVAEVKLDALLQA